MTVSRRTRRLVLCGITTLAAVGQAAAAQAVTIGQTGAGAQCNTGIVIVGRAAAPADGTVTAFRYLASGGTPDAQAEFEVLRPQGNGNYLVIGHTEPVSAAAGGGQVTTVPASIPIAAGDVLGSFSTAGNFPCGFASAEGDFLGFRPATPETGDSISASSPISNQLNLQADIATATPATLLRGRGVSAAGTRFDFTVTGTPAAPGGTATLTGDDGKRVRDAAITCYRQIDATRAIFGVRDPAPKAAATAYREFYASDRPSGDRLREQARRSATPPPAGCRTATPAATAGMKIRSGDITTG